VGQLVTGALSDWLGRKGLIVGGMWLQAAAIVLLPLTHGFVLWALAMALLGLGTALVYPTLLAAISDVAHPRWRASAVGVYRLWRDSGYAVGAILAGVLADRFGVPWAITGIGMLTFASGLVALARMSETLPDRRAGARRRLAPTMLAPGDAWPIDREARSRYDCLINAPHSCAAPANLSCLPAGRTRRLRRWP
jgi:MFS family permease